MDGYQSIPASRLHFPQYLLLVGCSNSCVVLYVIVYCAMIYNHPAFTLAISCSTISTLFYSQCFIFDSDTAVEAQIQLLQFYTPIILPVLWHNYNYIPSYCHSILYHHSPLSRYEFIWS